MLQAEKFRAKAQRPEQSRSHTQYCRYLYYLGRIKAIQLEYTDARDYLQQAARKVCSCTSHLSVFIHPADLHLHSCFVCLAAACRADSRMSKV